MKRIFEEYHQGELIRITELDDGIPSLDELNLRVQALEAAKVTTTSTLTEPTPTQDSVVTKVRKYLGV